MKIYLLSALILGSAAAAVAQGTLIFCNVNPAGLDAPVYGADGRTSRCAWIHSRIAEGMRGAHSAPEAPAPESLDRPRPKPHCRLILWYG